MVNCTKRKGESALLAMLVMIAMNQLTSADFSTLIRNSVQSSIERPERAALEPPTVTSLKPPERKTGGDHSPGGIPVQGDHSGSHIPPVVASRSPSSSYPRNYKNRYLHVDTHFSQSLAPVATASSGPQDGHLGVIAGRQSPYDTQHRPIVPLPTPHLSNATTVPVYHPPHWNPSAPYIPRNSYGSAGYPPVPRSRPRNPALYEDTIVPELPFTRGQKHGTDQHNGGGVWGETDEEQSGIWEHPNRHPGYSHEHHSIIEGRLRKDTFGHQISEDLSHLSGRHPLQRNNARGIITEEDEDIHIIHQNPPSHPHFPSHGVREESSPPLPRGRENNSSDRFGSPPATLGSHFGSGPARRANIPSQGPVTHGEVEENHHHRTHGSPRNGGHRVPYPDSVSTPERGVRRPLTAYDISQTHNMSTWEEFVEFLQRRGIRVGQVLKKLSDGATREEMESFLNSPDLIAPRPQENTDDHLKDMQEGPRDYTDIPAETEDGHHRHSGGGNRGGRKKNRRGKNKNRGRKNRNNRKKEKKDKHTPIFTTLVTPHADMTDYIAQERSHIHNFTESPTTLSASSMHESLLREHITDEPLSSTTSHSPTKSTQISKELPEHAIPPTQPTTEPDLQVTQVYDSDKATEFPVSTSHKTELKPATKTFTTPVSLSTLTKHVLAPTATSHITSSHVSILPAFLTTELSSAVKTTPLPSPVSPKAGSLTLPPSKPSEVSIIAFTVMKIPKQKAQEETVLKDVMPINSGQNNHMQHKQHHNFPTQRMGNRQRHYPSVSPKKIEENMVIRTPYVHEESKNNYTFPVKGFMIITGIMGALAVFTLVVLISYAIIKCSKQPVVNNYQVSEQKPTTQ
ncbi:uncharacterized protein LOC135225226 [Macrobrachium nipponense]|uniref:uncharacterized protein LOC135225226 n=1 Tax=Macrobrachium nipponense TaxID=159736 RepID=UPI0030C885B3